MYRLFLAIRWLLSRPINLLGVAGVTLGVWALVVVVSIFDGYGTEIAKHVRGAGADVSLVAIPAEGPGWPELAEALRADPAVAEVAPRLLWYGMLHPRGIDPAEREPSGPLDGDGLGLGDDTPYLNLIGVRSADELRTTEFAAWLAERVPPERRVTDLEAPFRSESELPSIILSDERMKRQKLARGDEVRLTTGRWHRDPSGRRLVTETQDFVVAGAFRTRHVGFDVATAFVDYEWLGAMLGLDPTREAHELAVALTTPDQSEAAVARLDRVARRVYQESRARAPTAVTWKARNVQILAAIEHQGSLMKLVLIVILVVAAFLMFATLSMMVTEKTRDIGILTAMGASPWGILQVFLLSGLTITAIGVVLGLVTGAISSFYLDGFNRFLRSTWDIDLFPTRVYQLDRVPYRLDPIWMAQVAAMAFATGLVVSGIPALRAALQDPVKPLRHE